MHPKLKAFMRTAMECEVATSQAPTSDAAGNAIENASEPQEMAATMATNVVATVAATPSDLGQGATHARLPEELPLPLKDTDSMKETQEMAPTLRRTRSRNSKKSSEDSHPGDEDCDTDDELQWCSKGIAVFLSPDDESEKNGRTEDGESMEFEQSEKSEMGCPTQQDQCKSMMACFKPKPKNCSTPTQLYPLSAEGGHGSQMSTELDVPSTISHATVKPSPSLPVTVASKLVPPPSIPHTFTPSGDVDMDTGESTAVALDNEEDQIKKCRQFVKLEEPERKTDCPVSSQSFLNGCLVGNAPIYAPNPFPLISTLPIMVKTEPGLSPSSLKHPRHSPLTGQSFIPQSSGQRNGFFDFPSPIASLPPMEALHCMPLEDLMRMNFIPLSPLKHNQNQRVISLHGNRAHSFFQKPESKTPSVGNAAKMFTCEQCGATFKHRHHVVRHMRAHTGEKPFRCEECGAMFARKCILTNHIRTHTGEKPYVCGECGDAFSRKHHLVIHRRTHTGEKPYVCSVCSTAFARSHHLNRHLKTHILMQQGHLNGIPLHPEGALDLSLQDKLPDRIGAVAQKAFLANGLPTTQVIETVTDCSPHVGQEEEVKS